MAFGAEPTIGRFDERIARGRTGPGAGDCDAETARSMVHVARNKFTALFDAYGPELTSLRMSSSLRS